MFEDASHLATSFSELRDYVQKTVEPLTRLPLYDVDFLVHCARRMKNNEPLRETDYRRIASIRARIDPLESPRDQTSINYSV